MSNSAKLPGELCRIETSRGGAIVATASDVSGRKVIDVRKYFATADAAELKPTKKGIAVDVARFPDLVHLLGDALTAAREHGLIGKGASHAATNAARNDAPEIASQLDAIVDLLTRRFRCGDMSRQAMSGFAVLFSNASRLTELELAIAADADAGKVSA